MKFNKQALKQCSALLITTTLLMTSTYADSGLPGSFPNTSVFKGAYKNIKDTEINFPLGNWNLMANGRIYNFMVKKKAGKLVANSRLGEVEIDWNRDNNKIVFTRLIIDKDPKRTIRQTYTGYLMYFSDGTGGAGPSKLDPKWRMAGTFNHQTPKIASNMRNSGWYATLPR